MNNEFRRLEMKKSFVMYCLLGVLFINCTSTGSVKNNDQNINTDILGELYIEKNVGFSMYIPKDWEIREAGQKYLMVMGPTEDNFTPNINFGDEQFSGQISEYIDACIGLIPQIFADFEVTQRENFVTNKGLQGGYITTQARLNEINVRQRIYVIPNKRGSIVMAITFSMPPSSGTKYDAIFDECVKTFDWSK
jgi:hypothetical protein